MKRICIDCGESFTKYIIIDGVKKSLQKRVRCLICKPYKYLPPKMTREERLESNRPRVISHRKKTIAQARTLLGDKCALCGYNKYYGALEFHHKDPSQKSFSICDGGTRSWKRIKAEAEKCVLLCANCHREVEAGISDINGL